MSEIRASLQSWRQRARPERRMLRRALISGLGASLVSSWLLTAAVTLLVFSATRPSWQRVAVWLIVVEVLAFLRAPLRFGERMSSHSLGYDAVTTWRRWLMNTVGHWSAATWTRFGTGDVADRALRDSDALSDLWVRGFLPLLTASATLLVGDAVIALLTWGRTWWLAPALVMVQVIVALALRITLAVLGATERAVRTQQGLLATQIIDGASVVHDLALLGATAVVSDRVRTALGPVERWERRSSRLGNLSTLIAVVYSLLSLGLILLASPSLRPLVVVAATWLALGGADVVDAAHQSLRSLIAVSASGERLDALDTHQADGVLEWPTAPSFAVTVQGQRRALPPGLHLAITGPSGVGKTTLLEALAALGDSPSPLTIDGSSASLFNEAALRAAIQFVPANPQLVRGYARDVLGMGRPVREGTWRQLAAVGLPLDPDQRIEQLSRGERQRFAVVRALATSPLIVLLDEPTGGLGVEDTQAMLRLLDDTGVTVVVATHDPLVIAWCDDALSLG